MLRFPRKLPDVLCAVEVGRLLEITPSLKYKAALGTASRIKTNLTNVQLAAINVDHCTGACGKPRRQNHRQVGFR